MATWEARASTKGSGQTPFPERRREEEGPSKSPPPPPPPPTSPSCEDEEDEEEEEEDDDISRRIEEKKKRRWSKETKTMQIKDTKERAPRECCWVNLRFSDIEIHVVHLIFIYIYISFSWII